MKNIYIADMSGQFIQTNTEVKQLLSQGTAVYKKNAVGHFVPLEAVKDADIFRDDFVNEIFAKVITQRDELIKFKKKLNEDLDAFVSLAAERYEITVGGDKGGVTVSSFDGRRKLVKAFSVTKSFDEGLVAAKVQVDNCIHKWAAGSRYEIRTLVEHAFQTDKQGNINIGRIYSLMQIKIDDPDWENAMKALHESLRPVSSKYYFRFYEKKTGDKYECVPLDLAAV